MMRRNLLARSLTIASAITAVISTACICRGYEGPSPAQDEAPRGMVAIPGGKVLLGSTAEEIQKLAARISDEGTIKILVAEYPQHEVQVDPFFISKNELTNREWKAFLDATGSNAVPHYYYVYAVEEEEADASDENGEGESENGGGENGDDKSGQEDEKATPQQYKGELREWKSKEIPTDSKGRSLADHPVAGISYNDILEYCRWAGLRLPTEAEWELAAKGPGQDRRFPWEGGWDPSLAQNYERPVTDDEKKNGWSVESTWPVKYNEKNKSVPYGLYDMAGNVWEFTSSPFELYPGNTPLEFRVRGKKTMIHPPSESFRRGRKVIKGGGYPNQMIAQRVSSRMGLVSTEWVEAVGFRTARSAVIGLDFLAAANEIEFLGAYGQESELDWTRIRGAERFRWDGDVQVGHEAIAFLPRKGMEDITSDSALRRKAKVDINKKTGEIEDLRETVLLGMLVSKLDFHERELSGGQILPMLPAGSYLVRYIEPRSDLGDPDAKKDAEGEETEEAAEETEEAAEEAADEEEENPREPGAIVLERGETYIVFEDPQGKVVAAVKLDKPVGKDKKRLDGFELEPAKGLVTIDSHFMIGRRRSQKPAEFTIRLAIEGEKIAGDWMTTPAPK